MYIKKNNIIIALFIVGIILFSLCFYIGFLAIGDHRLKPFKIISVEEIAGEVIFNVEKNFYAEKYEVIIYDEDNNILSDKKYDNNEGIVKDLNYYYLKPLKMKVIAIHDDKTELASSNTYLFNWNSPSFNESNSIYIQKDVDFPIIIDGDFTKAGYKLQIKNGSNLIYEKAIDEQLNPVPYDLLANYSGRLSATIINENNQKISSFNFYVNTVIIGNIKILSPVTANVSWDNFIFKYEGGANADSILLYIYKSTSKGNKLNRIIGITEEETELNINYFEEDATYTLELVAGYKDYKEIYRRDSTTITIGKKSPVGQVYTDINFSGLKPGSKLTLYSDTLDAKIMYSLDGKDPVVYGSMYTEPISITSDVILTAVAIKQNMNNSITSTFDIKIADKIPVVYLSPSNQKSNFGVKSVGYTNEREIMNKVTDVIEEVLKANGVKVYRNNPEDNMKIWLAESRDVKSDLHLAIHSNGSAGHNMEGMEIYVHEEISPAYSVAATIYNDLFALYQQAGRTVGRGVMFARGRMGEVHPLNINMGALIEIAYHDNKEDAKWIINNINEIGSSIANSVLRYFQVK